MRINKKTILLFSVFFIVSQLSGCSNIKNSETKVENKNTITSNIKENNNEESIDNKEDSNNNDDNKIDLLNQVTSQLKTLEGIEKVKEEVNGKFKEILTKNNFDIDYDTPNNGFVISESTYNKYSKDYQQNIYSLIADNYADGTVEIRMHATKEFHKEDKQTESDDFIKCIYDLYTYTSKENITIQEFVNKIQNSIDNDLGAVELNNYSSEQYIYILINDKENSTKELEFKFHAIVNDTVKRKYYKKEYETVNDYQNDTDSIKNKTGEIVKKYNNSSGNIEDNLHGVSDITIMSGQNKFMQTGSIAIVGGEASGKSGVPKLEQKEVNDLVNAYKLVLGDTLGSKVNTSQLTTESLNKLIESQIIINTYAHKYDLPNVDTYIDNAKIEFTHVGNFLEQDDENNWNFVTEDRYAGVYLQFSIPVIAEGISEM